MNPISSVARGFSFHFKGIGFVLRNPSYLPLCLIPLILTLILFATGFYFLSDHMGSMADWIWSVDPTQSSWYMKILYFIYKYLIRIIIYALVLGLMYFLFMVVTNIIAVPFYEVIVSRIRKRPEYAPLLGAEAEISVLKSVLEEVKKAIIVILIPLLFLFIPVIGAIISTVLSMMLLSWELLDVSLVRDQPLLGQRWDYFKTHKGSFLGFGVLLLIPFVGLFFFPFAIVGSSLMYLEELRVNAGHGQQAAQPPEAPQA